jgi:ribonuclease P protein component
VYPRRERDSFPRFFETRGLIYLSARLSRLFHVKQGPFRPWFDSSRARCIDWPELIVPRGAYVRICRAKAHLSAEETPSGATSRVSCPYVDLGRAKGPSATSGKGPDPSHRLANPRSRDRRLRRRADFDRLFQHGRHNSGRLLTLRSAPNEREWSRYAYAISKRVGNAVTRNRVKRRLREILRLNPPREGFDLVISARTEAAEAPYLTLRIELTKLLRRARLIDDEE